MCINPTDSSGNRQPSAALSRPPAPRHEGCNATAIRSASMSCPGAETPAIMITCAAQTNVHSFQRLAALPASAAKCHLLNASRAGKLPRERKEMAGAAARAPCNRPRAERPSCITHCGIFAARAGVAGRGNFHVCVDDEHREINRNVSPIVGLRVRVKLCV